jgi:hypothetical protein
MMKLTLGSSIDFIASDHQGRSTHELCPQPPGDVKASKSFCPLDTELQKICMCEICVAGLMWEMLDSPHLALYDTFFGLYFCALHGFASNCVAFVLHVLQNEHHLLCFACFAATSQQFFGLY